MAFTFDHVIQGENIYDDPFRIRRLLLEHTDGRCWRYLRDLAELNVQLATLQSTEQLLTEAAEKEKCVADIAVTVTAIVKLEGILVTAGYAAFELMPLNRETGEGVTEIEVMESLKLFIEFAEGKGLGVGM